MSTFATVAFVIVAIIVGIAINDHKVNQCEHNGLGKWHYWTQVCEPLPGTGR